MAVKRDYYDVLGIDRNADEKTIKKAYRKLAKKYHPDTNAGNADAADRFKEVNEAYDVLSDPKKKKMYDQFGHAAFEAGADPGAGGFGGNQRRQRNGSAEADGRQDERKGRRGDDADEDILVRRAEHARRLDQRFIHVDDALIDGHAHDEEAGDGDDDDLRLAADARRDDDQRHVSQRRDIADELNPRLDDVANRLIPRHQDGDRQRDDEAQRIAGNDRDETR